jgi:4-carboxymuconolactone decarboxylase
MTARTETQPAENERESYEAAYRLLFGEVPEAVYERWELVDAERRIKPAFLLEQLRGEVLLNSPLGLKTQQLVQFGQLIALGRQHSATLHAGAALKAGASRTELLAVAETALITSGVPAYGLGVEIIRALKGKA